MERRRRTLALALSSLSGPVNFDSLTNLDTEVARAYAGVSRRTLVRDVAALATLGLLRQAEDGLRVHRERVLAFLPWRHTPRDD